MMLRRAAPVSDDPLIRSADVGRCPHRECSEVIAPTTWRFLSPGVEARLGRTAYLPCRGRVCAIGSILAVRKSALMFAFDGETQTVDERYDGLLGYLLGIEGYGHGALGIG
jgi:hypothetical protein